MSDKNILKKLVDAIKGIRKSEGNPYHDARGRFASGGGGAGGKGKYQPPTGIPNIRTFAPEKTSPGMQRAQSVHDKKFKAYTQQIDKLQSEHKLLVKKMDAMTGREPSFDKIYKQAETNRKNLTAVANKRLALGYKPPFVGAGS